MRFPSRVLCKEEYTQKVKQIFVIQFEDLADKSPIVINQVVDVYSQFESAFKKNPNKRIFLKELSETIARMDIEDADRMESRLDEINSNTSMWFNFLYEYAHCDKYPDGNVEDITNEINPDRDPEKQGRCFELISAVATHCIRELARENSKEEILPKRKDGWRDLLGGSRSGLTLHRIKESKREHEGKNSADRSL